MKSLIFVLLLVGVIALVGCGGTPTKIEYYTIKVTGTEGLRFAGNYGGAVPGGGKSEQSVEGVVPAEYTVQGPSNTIVYCSFIKQAEDGTLNVQIFKNGELATQSGTAAPFGSVVLATN